MNRSPSIDRRRYRRVLFFFFRAFAHVFFWDVLLNRAGLRLLRRPPHPRWRRLARRFRELALEMGGVLIKLGQFLSVRVDLLPREVTRELAGLQDKIPAEPLASIEQRLDEAYGRPHGQVFSWLSPEPLGAASLAQVHQARLVNGEAVVVKVLRTGIRALVETDLAAVARACRWLQWYKPIARRVDLDWLIEEFTTVTRRELDLLAEGRTVERFRDFFAGNQLIAFPEVYLANSVTNALVLENVGYFKIDDLDALEKAGIDRRHVARDLFKLYMQQVFHQHLVHADPHPGNVFIKPLATAEERAAGRSGFQPGEAVPHTSDRPFKTVLVDYGMVAEIPQRLRKALREYAIGIATRDAHKVVQSYVHAGSLLPGADLSRLEEVHQVLFEHMWGVSLGKLQNAATNAFTQILTEYRDILFQMPFQVQVDLLFVLRSLELLNGLATYLDPEFNTVEALLPFARKMARRETSTKLGEWPKQLAELGAMLLTMPGRLDRVLTQAERGNLTVKYDWSRSARKSISGLEGAVHQLRRALIGVGFLLAGTYAKINGNPNHLGDGLLIAAGLVLAWALIRRN
jgi:predicted unusual protein kinase regulating ubiquinone biosynthesis (AarF/ABC1/UbiB family)